MSSYVLLHLSEPYVWVIIISNVKQYLRYSTTLVDIVELRVKPSCETSVVGVGDHELESDAASWSSNASKFWFGLHPLLNFIRGCSVCFRKVGQKCALDDGRVYRHLESCPKGICTSPPRQWKHLSASSNSWGNLVSWETFTINYSHPS